jgi:hypothetical protein
MSWNPLESIKLGLLIAVIIETVILLGWAFVRQRMRGWYFLAGPVILCLFLTLDIMVVTNREKLINNTRKLIKYAQNENAQGIIDLISDKFLFGNYLKKKPAADIIKTKFDKPIIDTNLVFNLKVVSVDQHRGQTDCTIITTFDPHSPYAIAQGLKTKWSFIFIRDPDGQYRLQNLILRSVNNNPHKKINIFKFRLGE